MNWVEVVKELAVNTVMFNSVVGIILYWCPMLMCAIGYFARTFKNYRKDIVARKIDRGYYPTDTIGDLIGRGLISIIPIGNLLAALFDVAPDMFSGIFKWFNRVFRQPLVPPRKEENKKPERNYQER